MSGQKVWSNILSEVKSQVSSSIFRTWFLGSYAIESADEGLVVGVKNNFIKEQLERRYMDTILGISQKSRLGTTKIKFVVAREETKKSLIEPLFSGVVPTYMGSTKNNNINPSHTFGNFVVGASNNLAYLAFSQSAAKPGSVYNPIFIWGPTGVGKTHLLQAFGNEVLSKILDCKVLYASAEKFTNDYIESLNNRSQQAFRQKYRSVDVLLVDDVQFFCGKESTQDEFFYTFNELFLSGKQIILACDKHPRDLGRIQERILSRFLGGLTLDIQKPDLELKIAILKAKCRERGIVLETDVLEYIAGTCESGVRELEGALIQVLSLTKLSGGKIGLAEIKGSIERNKPKESILPSPGKITDVVCRHFRVSREEVCSAKRKASLVRARQIIMYLLRKDLVISLDGVGELVGGRDHSTVLYAVEKIEENIKSNLSFADEISRIRGNYH